MRVCHLGDASVTHTWRWVDIMQKKGHETYLISLKPPREEFKNPNVKIFLVPKTNLKNPINLISTIIKIKNLVKKINPDFINAHYATHYGLFAALTGKPFICSVWGSDILVTPKKSKIIKAMTKYALKKTNYITCDAHHLSKAIEDFGIAGNKIKLIYYGVDINKFKRSKYIKEKKYPTVISIRNLIPNYDIETLIKAIPSVLREVPNTRFIIGGDGSQRKYLENLSKELNCSQNVKFVGRIRSDLLPKYFSVSDVYVSTALTDGGLSASTAEAMACELPVVITDFGDNSKWVNNYKNGFLFPLRDYETLAAKTIELLKNEKLRRKIGKLNRKTIESRLNLFKEMDKLDKLYKQLSGETR